MSKVLPFRKLVIVALGIGSVYYFCCLLIAHAISITIYGDSIAAAYRLVSSGDQACVNINPVTPSFWSARIPSSAWIWGFVLTPAVITCATITTLLIACCFTTPRAYIRKTFERTVASVLNRIIRSYAWFGNGSGHGVLSANPLKSDDMLIEWCNGGDSEKTTCVHQTSGRGVSTNA